MIKIRGRVPALIKIFFIKLRTTIIVSTPEGRKITIHTDGSISKSKIFIKQKLNET